MVLRDCKICEDSFHKKETYVAHLRLEVDYLKGRIREEKKELKYAEEEIKKYE